MRKLIPILFVSIISFQSFSQDLKLDNPKNYKYSSSFPFKVGQKNSELKNVQKALSIVPTGNFDEYTEHKLIRNGYNLDEGLTWEIFKRINIEYKKTNPTKSDKGTSSIIVSSNKNNNKQINKLLQSNLPIKKGEIHFIVGRIRECLGLITNYNFDDETTKEIELTGYDVSNGITLQLYEQIIKNCNCKDYNSKSLSNGATYKGQISNDLPNGHGTLFHPNGDVLFDGNWVNGLISGIAVEFFSELTYVGEFKENVEKGYGTVYYSDGKIQLEGEFIDGMQKINGKFYLPDGKLYYNGEMTNMIPWGLGTLYEDNGRFHHGFFEDGKKQGHGIYYNEDGTILYNGEWKNNFADGFGITYIDDKKFRGEFKDGQPNGEGILTYNNGETVKGLWENGNYINHGNDEVNSNNNLMSFLSLLYSVSNHSETDSEEYFHNNGQMRNDSRNNNSPKTKCYDCKGTGRCPTCNKVFKIQYWDGYHFTLRNETKPGYVTCSECNGAGVIYGLKSIAEDSPPMKPCHVHNCINGWIPCRECNSSGKGKNLGVCQDCNGTGYHTPK